MGLDLTPRPTAEADAIFEQLTMLHDGLNDAQSAAANAKLVIVLAQHIGDAEVVAEAVRLVRDSSA